MPERTCISCRQVQEKKNLIRIVKTFSGEIRMDASGKADGRGAYLCRSAECVEKATKKKMLNRAMKCNVSQGVYQELESMVKHYDP